MTECGREVLGQCWSAQEAVVTGLENSALTTTMKIQRTKPAPCLSAMCVPEHLPTTLATASGRAKCHHTWPLAVNRMSAANVGRDVEQLGRGRGVEKVVTQQTHEQNTKKLPCRDRRSRRRTPRSGRWRRRRRRRRAPSGGGCGGAPDPFWPGCRAAASAAPGAATCAGSRATPTVTAQAPAKAPAKPAAAAGQHGAPAHCTRRLYCPGWPWWCPTPRRSCWCPAAWRGVRWERWQTARAARSGRRLHDRIDKAGKQGGQRNQ